MGDCLLEAKYRIILKAEGKIDQASTLRKSAPVLQFLAFTCKGAIYAPMGRCLARAFSFHGVRQELSESAVPTKK